MAWLVIGADVAAFAVGWAIGRWQQNRTTRRLLRHLYAAEMVVYPPTTTELHDGLAP